MSKMFMNVKEVMEVLEVSESYAYKLMKRLNRELQAMGCQTIAGKVDRKEKAGKIQTRGYRLPDYLSVNYRLRKGALNQGVLTVGQ